MTSSILAHLRRVSTSPEGRALVHAVDDAGLEYKIEVPIEAVRGVSPEQGHVLVLSWSLETAPRAAEPATTTKEPPSAATSRSSTPSAVDKAFMELMGRPHGSTTAAAASVPTASPSTDSTSQKLTELFRLGRI